MLNRKVRKEGDKPQSTPSAQRNKTAKNAEEKVNRKGRKGRKEGDKPQSSPSAQRGLN
ncbi:hypothetical protein MASR2M39_29710 [Ignavibacteriales bacterium]